MSLGKLTNIGRGGYCESCGEQLSDWERGYCGSCDGGFASDGEAEWLRSRMSGVRYFNVGVYEAEEKIDAWLESEGVGDRWRAKCLQKGSVVPDNAFAIGTVTVRQGDPPFTIVIKERSVLWERS